MTKQQAIDNIEQIFEEVTKTDDAIIKSLESLKIVLLNLKIEGAKIKESNGIAPISDKLSKEISNIEDAIKELVKNNREKLYESTEVLRSE